MTSTTLLCLKSLCGGGVPSSHVPPWRLGLSIFFLSFSNALVSSPSLAVHRLSIYLCLLCACVTHLSWRCLLHLFLFRESEEILRVCDERRDATRDREGQTPEGKHGRQLAQWRPGLGKETSTSTGFPERHSAVIAPAGHHCNGRSGHLNATFGRGQRHGLYGSDWTPLGPF